MKKGLLEDDRIKYGAGGKLVTGVADLIAALKSKRSKLEKELLTEDMSKASRKENIKQIQDIDERLGPLRKTTRRRSYTRTISWYRSSKVCRV